MVRKIVAHLQYSEYHKSMSAITSTASGDDALPQAIQITARVGYVARAVFYVIIGVLALLASLDLGGATVGSDGVLSWVVAAPMGDVLLVVLAAGMLAYCVWRAIQVFYDPDDHGMDAKGIAIRGAFVVSILTHAALAYAALQMVFGSSSGSDGGTAEKIDSLMGMSWGPWLVGIGGTIAIIAGIVHLYKAYAAKFEERLSTPPRHQDWVRVVCRIGLTTRGLAFMTSGGLALALALGYNAEAGGMTRILEEAQSYGPIPLAIIAVGFFCFGAYSVIEAIWRRVDTTDVVYSG